MQVAALQCSEMLPLMSGSMSCSSSRHEGTQAEEKQTLPFLSAESSHTCVQYSQNPNLSPCLYRCIATIKGSGSAYVSGLTVDGAALYIASSDGHIRLWPLDTAMDVQRPEESSSTVAITDSAIKCVVSTSDGLVSSHQDGKIRVWRATAAGRGNGDGSRRLALRAVLPTAADCLRTFLFPSSYVEVRRHRRRTWVHHADAVAALAVSPDGARMYSVSWDRSLKAWRLRPGLRCDESVAAAHDDAINAVAVSQDGHRVYTGSADTTVRAWRRRPGPGQQGKLALVGTMARHKAAVNALALAVGIGGGGGEVLYSGACDRTVVVWERSAAAGEQVAAAVATLRGHTGPVLCLAAAGDVVCSGSADRTVRVWRREVAAAAASYTCVVVLDGHAGAVKSLALASRSSPGGDHDGGCSGPLVCSGSLDCDVKIWSVTVS